MHGIKMIQILVKKFVDRLNQCLHGLENFIRMNQVIQINPKDKDAYYNLGLVKEKLGRMDEAKECFNLYLAANPKSQDAEQVKAKLYELDYVNKRGDDAKKEEDRSYELCEAKDYEGAMAAAKEAIRLNPKSGWALYRLGFALSRIQRFEEAVKECEEAIRLEPRNLNFYVTCGYCYGELGDPAKTRDVVEEGLRQDPWGTNLAYAHKNLGWAYERLGDTDKAVKNYELAIVQGHPNKDSIQQSINNLKGR